MASRDRELQTMRGALADGLPDELVLCIMSRLPWPAKARCRCVSRAWNHALLHNRRPFLLVAKVMADYGASVHDWRLLDPLSLQCNHIIKEDIFSVQPLTASAASRDAVFFQHSAHLSWLNLDRMQWTLLPSPPHQCPTNFMSPGATSFGTAIIDGYMYIAGGGSNRVQRLKLGGHEGKSASASSWSWECLPDMHECRGSPKALVLGGCLYVIGGTTQDYMSVNSGEVWDSSRKEWTLMPELWPRDVFGKLFAPPLNAVVARGRLYAITNLTRDIMYYEATTKVWKNLCSLSTFDHKDFYAFPVDHSLVAVGNELWVAVNTQAFVRGLGKVFTTTVTPAGTDPHVPPSWKLLPTLDNIRYTNVVVHL